MNIDVRALLLVVVCGCTPKSQAPRVAEVLPASTVSDTAGNASEDDASAPEAEPALDARYVWDLTDIYPSEAAWDAARIEVLGRVEKLKRHQGTLNNGAAHLADVLDEMYAVQKDAARVYSYSSLSRDEDQRVAQGQSRFERARSMVSEAGQATAWMQPELLAIGKAKIEKFIAQEKRLAQYAFYLRDTVRLAPHTLDPAGEQLMAAAGLVLSSPAQIYSLLANADIPWPTVTLADGSSAFLNSSGYVRHRSSANREDRKKVFAAFFDMWGEFADSIG
ncbi:MAG: oligoendopeptidase F, partial [Myxococcota bacterium]